MLKNTFLIQKKIRTLFTGTLFLLTQKRYMIGRLRYIIGHIEQKDSKRQQNNHSDLYFLTGRTKEYRQQENRRENTWKDDVHDVERMATSHHDHETNVGETFIGTA